jgi:hypothetical protein
VLRGLRAEHNSCVKQDPEPPTSLPPCCLGSVQLLRTIGPLFSRAGEKEAGSFRLGHGLLGSPGEDAETRFDGGRQTSL